jgi:hypothetical protein
MAWFGLAKVALQAGTHIFKKASRDENGYG